MISFTVLSRNFLSIVNFTPIMQENLLFFMYDLKFYFSVGKE